MKKAFAIALCLALVFVMCACAPKKEKPEPAYVAPESADPAKDPDSPYNSGTNLSDSLFVGTFETVYCALNAAPAEDVYKDSGTPPVIVCNADGTFMLTVYERYGKDGTEGSGIGSVTVKGTFTVDEDNAEFTITENTDALYLGSEVESFTMTLRDENTLRYSGEQIATTVKGDLFERAD